MKKIRGLYVSLDHIIDESMMSSVESIDNGIIKKILNQYFCMVDNGFVMEMYCPYKGLPRIKHSIARRLPFTGYHSYGKSIIKNASKYDFVFIRSPWFMDVDTPIFLSRLKKNNPHIKIVLEIPTFTKSFGEANKISMWPLIIKHKIATKRLKKCVDRIFTFSDVDKIMGIKTINSTNAINPNTINKIVPQDRKDSFSIVLIACSSLAFWHGYDRAIEGLNNYYKTKPSRYKVYLLIVGEGEEFAKYSKLIQKYNLCDYIKLFGRKSGKELDDIYSSSDIALDSLARHRSKIYFNSSLKGKEYCAKGLPIISGVKTELDYDKTFEFYMRIPADETPLNIEDVIAFYENVYLNKKTRQEIIDYISRYAREHFSYNVSLKPLFDYLVEEKR